MAWTAPRTWTTGEMVTAALLNAQLRDNLLETEAAKVTTANDLVYASGANAVARLGIGSSGQVLTVSGGLPAWATPVGTDIWQSVVEKTADEDVTSSTALQNDNHLLLAVAANEIWMGEIWLFFGEPVGSGTPDIKFAFAIPSGSGRYLFFGHDTVSNRGNYASLTTAQTVHTGDLPTPGPIIIRFYFANGATPGNLQFQWAQNVSSGNATRVSKGSLLLAREID